MVILTTPLSMVHESPLSVRVTGWLTVTLATFGSAADVCATAPDDNTADRARNAELTRTRELDINATLSNNPRGRLWRWGRLCGIGWRNVGLSQRWIYLVVLFREFGCGHYILCGRIDCFIDLDAEDVAGAEHVAGKDHHLVARSERLG